MKKKLVALLLVMAFAVTGVYAGNVEVQAAGVEEEMDVSYLLLEDALVGYAELRTRGVYLAEGYSSINDAGGGKIGCGGVTNAARRCTVKVSSIVERKSGSSWLHVTSWSKTNENALTASISKYLSVTSGYYYRVRSIHTAGTDGSSSWTNGIWM